jgi:dolichol kinase
VAYPIRLLLRDGSLQLPRSLDPSPLLYPSLFPVLIALSLTPANAGTSNVNPFLMVNLILSLSNLPPALTSSWDLHWLLSLFPLLPMHWDQSYSSINDTLSLITPINATLTSALMGILHPSLTASELRLLSSALINLLFHGSSPQAIILRTLVWVGGVSVFVFCEDVIKWNVSLARVPLHRFKGAGHAIIGIARFRKLAGLRDMPWATSKQASDSEADIDFIKVRPRKPRKRSYFATLTRKEAQVRRLGYATFVYGVVIALVFVVLRPYIGKHALDGIDPFVWALSYVFCGKEWYQSLVDRVSPGTGYCVTTGSMEAANMRLIIIGLWAAILTVGLSFVGFFAPRLSVDTRRKVFHGMAILMFLIPGLIDPPFTHLCLSLAVSIFLLVDLVRAGQLPPASQYIARFLQPYVDGRDLRGPMVVSHVFLLLGTGIGWWFTLAGRKQDSWDWDGRPELSFSTGVVCVGLGDAAASLIGRRFGRHKWGWKGGKSIEGSLAFTFAVVLGLSVARLWITGPDGDWGLMIWVKLLFAGLWGSMLEAVATGVNDNVVVPIGVWAVVRGLAL